MTMIPEIDWTPLHQWPPNEIECECFNIYRSHSKHIVHDGQLVGVTEIPCPACGAYAGHIRRASSGPEEQTI